MLQKYIFAAIISCVVLVGIFLYQHNRFNDGKLHVIFCDVGQGDGMFIRTPQGSDIVIDGGPDDKILSCLANHMPFWDRTIELMILTHPHVDHYYGLSQIAKRYTVKAFATQAMEVNNDGYKTLLKRLSSNKTRTHILCKNDSFTLRDGITLQTFWPTSCEKGIAEDDIDLNSLSVVQLLSFKDFQLLLTGDIDESIAGQLSDLVGDIEVLKVPHHGSGTGFDEQFLKNVTPELAVILVGKENRYGHPAKTIIDLLDEQSIKTFRTDQHGEIHLISDGKTFWVTK